MPKGLSWLIWTGSKSKNWRSGGGRCRSSAQFGCRWAGCRNATAPDECISTLRCGVLQGVVPLDA